MAIAGLLPAGDRATLERRSTATLRRLGADPRGTVRDGRGAGGFAYDNERPRHTVEVPAFEIARRPVSNGAGCASARAAATSAGSGGRTRAGRGRRSTTSRTIRPWRPARADAPVCHVSWFEADAFATSARRATAHRGRVGEGGDLEPEDRGRAGARRSAAGVGRVWEWTRSHFSGYPGFAAHPYREYSEVFFGEGYRVLRGASWATDPRVAALTLPQLGPSPAPPDLRRPAPGQGRLMEPSTPATPSEPLAEAAIRIDSHLDGARGTLARRGRARRAHAPLQGAAAEAFLRRPRRRAVRAHLRAARVLPDARGALDPRERRPRSWRS